MNFVDWKALAAGKTDTQFKVLFSVLTTDVEPTIDVNLVAIELPDGRYIDVEWVKKLGRYVVTLFQDDIDNAIVQIKRTRVEEVIGDVLDLLACKPYFPPSGWLPPWERDWTLA